MATSKITAPKINRAKFYQKVRQSFFAGKLSQMQVDGMENILNEWDKRDLKDLRWLAYMLATTYHETAKTMQPIEEYGKGKGRSYGKAINGKIYYGRGFVQLTWVRNYKLLGDLLNVDLVNHPDMALDCNIATQILFEGMIKGLFTGKSLYNYFDCDFEYWINARKIINGTDMAEVIADYGKRFYSALT